MAVKKLLACLVAGALPVFAACGDDSSTDSFEVISTNDKCTTDVTKFDAGDLTFVVKNEGDQPTELYVYGENDKIMSEVENVGPGVSRDLTVSLKAGEYELACKPGQTGDGIRVPIVVTGSGGDQSAEEAEYDREFGLDATEYKFSGAPTDVKVGEAIEFKMANKGTLDHEMELFDPDGKAMGEIEPVKPGQTGEAVFEFKEAGTYEMVCGVDDHKAKGMTKEFTVE